MCFHQRCADTTPFPPLLTGRKARAPRDEEAVDAEAHGAEGPKGGQAALRAAEARHDSGRAGLVGTVRESGVQGKVPRDNDQGSRLTWRSLSAAGVASGPAVSMALRSTSAAASMRAMMSPATPASPAPPSSASGSTSAAAAAREEETRVIFKGRGAGSRAPRASRCSGPRRATLARPHPHTRTHPLAHPASQRLPGALRGASHALGARGAAWSLRVPRSAPGAT